VKDYKFSIECLLVGLLMIVPVFLRPSNGQLTDFHIEQNDCFLERNEKVFVQLDKNTYISGQPLMYKAYVVNASSLKKSTQSRIIYFDITGSNDKLVYSWRSNLNKSICSGSVIIPDTIPGGIYTLRAYTNWMRNVSPAFYFKTGIIITKINESGLKQIQGPAMPFDYETGSLSLKQITCKSGYNLDIETAQPDEIIINISSEDEGIFNSGLFHLLMRSRGRILKNIPVTLSNGTAKVIISKNDIPAGILCIVLLNHYNNTVAEKLTYIYPDNYPSVKINALQKAYKKGDKVVLELELNNTGYTDTAWLSVSVSEKTPFQDFINNQGITSYMLFYSEFEPDNYEWDILPDNNKRPCTFIPENRGFVLTGKVLQKTDNEPIKNELTMLSYADSITSLKYCYTDSSGKFYFLLDQSYDNRDLILQLINYGTGTKSITWEIDNKFNPYTSLNNSTLELSPEAIEYLEYCRKITLINEIYNAKGKSNSMPPVINNACERRNFCGKPDYEIYPADFVELDDFREISENILPGVKFRKRRDIYYVQIYDFKNKIIMPPGATVLLNGVPCQSLDYISSLGSNDIKRIDVFQSQILYGELSFYGLLSIHTYDGKIPEAYLDNHAYIYKNEVRLPYTFPVNDIILQTEKRIKNQPDFRQTLYWNPSLIISGTNKAIIEFTASDLEAGYNISVQGITSGGIPLEAASEIEVK